MQFAAKPKGDKPWSGWPQFRALLLEAVLLGALLSIYMWGRHVISGQISEAKHNASAVWDTERLMNLPDEAQLQSWALSVSNLVKLSNWYYYGMHFPTTGLVLAWLFVWHRSAYQRIRLELVFLTAAALAVHMLYPLAPPRLMPQFDMTDTMSSVGPSVYPPGDTGVANQFAAMPSLHVGWAILVAIAITRVLNTPWRWLAWLHPLATTLVVVITANHYWLDGLVALALLLMSIVLVSTYEFVKTPPLTPVELLGHS